MPTSPRSSASTQRSATESAPPEQPTATRSPGRRSCCSRIYFRIFSSIETLDASYHCEIISGPMYRKHLTLTRRAVYSFALGCGIFVLGVSLRTLLDSWGVTGVAAAIDDMLIGLLAGVLVFAYERHQHKIIHEKMRVIS